MKTLHRPTTANNESFYTYNMRKGRGPGAVVKLSALESRWSRVHNPLWHSSLKKPICFFPAHSWKLNIAGSLRDREVACSTSDRWGANFELCGWMAVSSHSSHHPPEMLLAQFSVHVHNGGLKPHSFHFIVMIRKNKKFTWEIINTWKIPV